MNMSIFLLVAMTLNGQEHPAGSTITVPHAAGLTAVKDKLAREVETLVAATPPVVGNDIAAFPWSNPPTQDELRRFLSNPAFEIATEGEYMQKPLEGLISGPNAGDEQTPTVTDEEAKAVEIERVRKALDAQYKAEELKAAAKAVNVDFAYDDNKPVVIQKIIDQGKAEELLK